MELIGFIADHPTPKICIGGGTAFTMNSRDYKGVMIVIYNSSGGGISGTLDANYYKGQGLRQGVVREYIVEIQQDVVSKDNRSADGEQSSRELLRTGCVQQHASNGEQR